MKTYLQNLARIPFVRQVATLQLGQIISIGCGFLSSIFFARLLGVSGYGQYAIVLSFTGIFGFLTNFGQQASTITFFSQAFGKRNKSEEARALHYYVFMTYLTTITLLILFAILPWLATKTYGEDTIGQLARLVIASSIFDPIVVFVLIVLQSVREIRLLAWLENGRIATQVGLSIILLLHTPAVSSVLLGTLLGTAIFAVIALFTYPSIARKYQLPSLSRLLLPVSPMVVWPLMRDGFWIAIDKLVSSQYPNLFMFFLSLVSNESVVGLLRLAFKLANLPISFGIGNIARLANSVLAELAGKGANLHKVIDKLISHTAAIYISITVVAAIIIPPLIPVIYGPNFTVARFPFYVILIINLLQIVNVFITPILRIYSKIYLATIANTFGFIVSGILFFALEQVAPVTWAFYVAIGVYHVIALTVLFPAIQLLRSSNNIQQPT